MDTMAGGIAAGAATCADERYELLGFLGRGGMARVWKARDRATGEIVALKSLHPSLTHDPQLVRRFECEAAFASRIRHANVAVVEGIVEQRDERFLRMEYVEGTTLETILGSRGRLPVQVALGLMRQICSGVQATHDAGFVHRDLKPANILVSRSNGRAVIVDFGIAKSIAESGVTLVGSIVGSLEYMSPEQACGDDITSLTDVYALGVVLYEMVTGVCPFRAPNLTIPKCLALRENVVDPRVHVPELPSFLADAIGRCLEHRAEARFLSPQEMWASLGAHAEDASERNVVLYIDGAELIIGAQALAVVAAPAGPLRDSLVGCLERIGCRVVAFDDGREALAHTFQNRSNLIVLSETAGGIDPWTACQVMKRFARWDATRTLVLVNRAVEAAESEALRVGATEVAGLPLDLDDFARKVRRLLA